MILTQLKLKLRNKVRIQPGSNLQVSPSARISNCFINVRGNNNNLIIGARVALRGVHIEIIGDNCRIEIHKETIIGKGCYLSARERGTHLIIGEKCMLSRNVKLMTSDGHDILEQGKRTNPALNINIGNKVWLADGVVVLKGVTAGNGSIVGINSVLTRSIGARTLAAGNPAKVIREKIEYRQELTY